MSLLALFAIQLLSHFVLAANPGLDQPFNGVPTPKVPPFSIPSTTDSPTSSLSYVNAEVSVEVAALASNIASYDIVYVHYDQAVTLTGEGLITVEAYNYSDTTSLCETLVGYFYNNLIPLVGAPCFSGCLHCSFFTSNSSLIYTYRVYINPSFASDPFVDLSTYLPSKTVVFREVEYCNPVCAGLTPFSAIPNTTSVVSEATINQCQNVLTCNGSVRINRQFFYNASTSSVLMVGYHYTDIGCRFPWFTFSFPCFRCTGLGYGTSESAQWFCLPASSASSSFALMTTSLFALLSFLIL